MSKKIVFCADGTWNGLEDDPTNVLKLFGRLEGSFTADTIMKADEQEKEFRDGVGQLVQIAKYIHGVGDSKNPVTKICGGVFGTGTVPRIVRGYTFICRNYEPGDEIVIVGFSRGAYTARALAGLIVAVGLLKKNLVPAADKIVAYENGAKAWYKYWVHARKVTNPLAYLATSLAYLPAYIFHDTLNDTTDFVEVDKILAVGVWDTVGQLGIPKVGILGDWNDDFKFADHDLNPKVQFGFHALSLDEKRASFPPTFWADRNNVCQVLFPGAHSDVGGGYPESGLSDISLDWMLRQLQGKGVDFCNHQVSGFQPDAAGTAHDSCSHPPFDLLKPKVRDFRNARINGSQSVTLKVHSSVIARMNAGKVKPDPKRAAVAYKPLNLPGSYITVS